MFCTKCGNDVPEGMKFCTSCGAEVKLGAVCSTCGNSLKDGARFCGSCGTAVATLQAQAEELKDVVTENIESTVSDSDEKSEDVIISNPSEVENPIGVDNSTPVESRVVKLSTPSGIISFTIPFSLAKEGEYIFEFWDGELCIFSLDVMKNNF